MHMLGNEGENVNEWRVIRAPALHVGQETDSGGSGGAKGPFTEVASGS